MKETNNVEQRPRTSLSKGARRNQVLRRITVVGVIAAVITAAFAGYCLHRERVEEKQKAEELRKEKQDKKRQAKVMIKARKLPNRNWNVYESRQRNTDIRKM